MVHDNLIAKNREHGNSYQDSCTMFEMSGLNNDELIDWLKCGL